MVRQQTERVMAVQIRRKLLRLGLILLEFWITHRLFQNQVHHGQRIRRGISYDPIPPKAGRLDHKLHCSSNRITDAQNRSET